MILIAIIPYIRHTTTCLNQFVNRVVQFVNHLKFFYDCGRWQETLYIFSDLQWKPMAEEVGPDPEKKTPVKTLVGWAMEGSSFGKLPQGREQRKPTGIFPLHFPSWELKNGKKLPPRPYEKTLFPGGLGSLDFAWISDFEKSFRNLAVSSWSWQFPWHSLGEFSTSHGGDRCYWRISGNIRPKIGERHSRPSFGGLRAERCMPRRINGTRFPGGGTLQR